MTGQAIAVDFWTPPDAVALWQAGIRLVLPYSGAARPAQAWIDQWLALGGQLIFIFESLPTRAYAGFDAGVEDARFHLRRIAEVGCPPSASIVICAADTPDVRGFEDQITAYFQGWRSVDPTARLHISYGGRGANAAAHADLAWGVGTWDYGEGSGANQMPDTSDAALLQSGNTPGPEGSDRDWVYVPLEELRAWSSTPHPTSLRRHHDMEILCGQLEHPRQLPDPDGGGPAPIPAHEPIAVLTNGGVTLQSWAAQGTDAPYGIPIYAAQWRNAQPDPESIAVRLVTPSMLARQLAAA